MDHLVAVWEGEVETVESFLSFLLKENFLKGLLEEGLKNRGRHWGVHDNNDRSTCLKRVYSVD